MISDICELLFPNVSGHQNTKLGLLSMMTSQWDTPTERERLHLLLHGKPGTGKSALMLPLEQNWGSKYISTNPSTASLKADARRKDRGAQIFTKNDGNIVCIDDIELFTDMDSSLRDVMERGFYSDTRGGVDLEHAARCRILAATNDIKKMPSPISSRFDLVFNFDFPTVNQSLDIVHQMLHSNNDNIDYLPMLQYYISMAQSHTPSILEKEKIEEQFKIHFKKYGQPNEEGEQKGKEGRWIATVIRIAKAQARIKLGDVGTAEITIALDMKRNSDKILGW